MTVFLETKRLIVNQRPKLTPPLPVITALFDQIIYDF
jgi:hypothetical protein